MPKRPGGSRDLPGLPAYAQPGSFHSAGHRPGIAGL